MSNLGDLVYNLIGNSTSFVGANDRARASNDVLHGSVNSIIGQLMRQKKAYEDVGKSTLDYIAADKKASDETKEHAVALMGEVNALKQLAEWRQKNASVANASRPYNDRLALGMGDTRLTPTQLMANAAAPGRDLRQKELDEVFGLDPKRHADRKAQLAAATDQRIADEQDRIQSTALARQERRLTDSLHRQTELRLRQQAASNALDDRKWFAPDASARQAADDKLVMQQLTDQGYFAPGGKGHKKQNQTARDNRQWAGVEGFRAIEDFAQGSAYGGLRGGLLAASNNIAQMGAAFGAAGAMAGSAISTVIILGSTLYESWRKGVSGANEAEHALKMYDRALSETIPHILKLNDLQVARQDMRNLDAGGADIAVKNMTRDLDKAKLELKEKEKAEAALKTGMGISGLSSDDLKNEARRRADALLPFTQSVFDTIGGLTPVQNQLRNLPTEVLSDDNIEKVRKLQQEKLDTNRIVVEMETNLLTQQKAQLELRRNADREAEQEIEQGFARFQAHLRGGKGPRTDWEMIEERRARNNAQNQREMEKFGRGQSWMQSRSEDLLLSGMRDPKDQAAYRAEKEHQESLRRSAEAERMGILTPDERARLDKASMAKRDRDMREAKYGNLQADGASGFGSADVKSTQGFNAVIKAMRYAEQDKTIQQLKQNGDIAAEQLASQQRVEEILKTAPIPVVDF